MRRFCVRSLEDPFEQFAFDPEQTRHIQKVLRLDTGDNINVFDGSGNEFLCVIRGFRNKKVYAQALEQIAPVSSESPLNLQLGIALTKGNKFDLVIQKAVELGVSSLVPISTLRSDVKAKNTEKKLERWKKIIIEASKQSGRATLMDISAPQDISSFFETAEGLKLMFSERKGRRFSEIKSSNKITAVIGPEGGWEDLEIDLAKKHGFQITTLGGRILRAETAAISIAAILQNQFGDIN